VDSRHQNKGLVKALLDVAGYPNSPGAAKRKLLGDLVINRDHTELIPGRGFCVRSGFRPYMRFNIHP
jgi:hypothetical protein